MTRQECKCDGFQDAWSYSSGHYTITVHDDECPWSQGPSGQPREPCDHKNRKEVHAKTSWGEIDGWQCLDCGEETL